MTDTAVHDKVMLICSPRSFTVENKSRVVLQKLMSQGYNS